MLNTTDAFLIAPLFCFVIFLLQTAVTACFHCVVDSLDARTIAAAGFQVGIAAIIGLTVLNSRDYKGRTRYPAIHVLCMCALTGARSRRGFHETGPGLRERSRCDRQQLAMLPATLR
jgi:hypothetical protein